MNCIECRTALLTADRQDLRGESAGPLPDHLRDCIECRARALLLEGSNELLAEMLLARRGTQVSEPVPRLRGRIAALSLVPLAAALIGLWVISGRDQQASVSSPRVLVAPNGVSLEAQAGQRATVIPTSTPNVTIIWLSEGDTE